MAQRKLLGKRVYTLICCRLKSPVCRFNGNRRRDVARGVFNPAKKPEVVLMMSVNDGKAKLRRLDLGDLDFCRTNFGMPHAAIF